MFPAHARSDSGPSKTWAQAGGDRRDGTRCAQARPVPARLGSGPVGAPGKTPPDVNPLPPFLPQVVLKGDARRLNVHGVSGTTSGFRWRRCSGAHPLCSVGLKAAYGQSEAGMGTRRHRVAGNRGGKLRTRGWFGNWAELPAGNTREEPPQRRDFWWEQGHTWGIARGAMCSHPPSPSVPPPAADLCRLPGRF